MKKVKKQAPTQNIFIGVRVDRNLINAIDRAAAEQQASRSYIIRRALDKVFNPVK